MWPDGLVWRVIVTLFVMGVSLLSDGGQDAAQKIGIEQRQGVDTEPRHQIVRKAFAGETARPGRIDVGDQSGAHARDQDLATGWLRDILIAIA